MININDRATQSSDKEVFQKKFLEIRREKKEAAVPKLFTEEDQKKLKRAIWKVRIIFLIIIK